MRVIIGGEPYEGSPVEIVTELKERAWFEGDIDEYMVWVARNVWRLTGKGMKIKRKDEGTVEERCVNFLRELGKITGGCM